MNKQVEELVEWARLTDEEIHNIKNLQYSPNMDESELFMVALRGVAQAQIKRCYSHPDLALKKGGEELPIDNHWLDAANQEILNAQHPDIGLARLAQESRAIADAIKAYQKRLKDANYQPVIFISEALKEKDER